VKRLSSGPGNCDGVNAETTCHSRCTRAFIVTMKKPIVRLIGQDGNAYMILGLCQRAAKQAGWSQERIDAVMKEMRSKDYDHLLQTAIKYFEVK
jgi:hypothetical protein